MTSAEVTEAWTYADFQPGHNFGKMSIVLDVDRLAQWDAIYGGGGDSNDPARLVPQGLLVTCMMEAYLGLIQPRPPGNIHAGQSIVFGTSHVWLGDTVTITASCMDKTLRKGRGWVIFEVTVARGDQTLLRGEIRSIWAR
jgi:hypothetical protein